MGFTGLALGAMLFRDGIAKAAGSGQPGEPHFLPKAKHVIWLFMLGGTSHVESFDPKPALNKYAGMTIEKSPYKKTVLDSPYYRKNVRDFAGGPRALMASIFPMQVGYRKRGQSGIEVSDWWPHLGDVIDDIAVIRSVWTTDNDHAAQYQFHTGRHVFDGSHPAIGSWVHYGLGSLNDNLPSFVALGDPPGTCCGGAGAQNGSYLGPEHNAVQLKVGDKDPLPYASPGGNAFVEEQEREFELLRDLNAMSAAKYPDDPALRARIKSYELAFRMQRTVPEILAIDKENGATKKLYGLDNGVTQKFGQLCLTARRLVERGVRFVQVYHGDGQGSLWDAHSNLKENHSRLCPQVDRPIAGLLKDLKQRGLLNETIVVWATEFGRTPGAENGTGRDHHPYGFSVWMAGGGLRGGIAHGATDELGFHAVEKRHYVTDIHATVLHQLGLDSHKLEIPGHKRLKLDYGHPIREIIA
ncbi:MAG TPA: DUF1501 domain-containing protein [Gemmataceae bacterium]|nr:DUF1501 domain-containing protein [Gemmataceae bacterium]